MWRDAVVWSKNFKARLKQPVSLLVVSFCHLSALVKTRTKFVGTTDKSSLSLRLTFVKFHVSSASALALLLAIAGCGGGGGGGGSSSPEIDAWIADSCSLTSAAGTITYKTNWTGATPAAASQVIQVLSSTGTPVRSDTINRGAGASDTIDLASIAAGVYEVKIRLYNGPNASGSEIGTARAIADICSKSNAKVESNSGDFATKLEVFPSNAEVKKQKSVRLVAMTSDGSGPIRFAASGSVEWNLVSGSGTLNSSGVFTGTAIGTAIVGATVTGTTITGQSTLQVVENSVTKTKWTVLVYLNAANDLFVASDKNVNQMEKAATNPNVRFVVQWKQAKDLFPTSSFDGVRRYLVKPDTTNQIKSELVQNDLRDGSNKPLDMGQPQTLSDFIAWGKANYPADRYCLIIWNHGSGWKRSPNASDSRAFSFDDQYGTSIQTWDIGTALGSEHFDIIAWDCSLMQMVEVAYELRNNADYVVGSEESPPADGYPYDSVFTPWASNPDETTRNLSKTFVDAMTSNPAYAGNKITQSSLETAKLGALASAISNLGSLLNGSGLTAQIQFARNNSQPYSQNATRYYRDLIDACTKLESQPGVPANILTASANVRAAAADAIAWEGHNGNSAFSRGISIDFSSSATFGALSTDYAKMKFGQDTLWDEFLQTAP